MLPPPSATGVKLRPLKFIKPFIKQDFTLYTTANRAKKPLLGFLNRFNNLEGFGKPSEKSEQADGGFLAFRKVGTGRQRL
jgi:hypothetical protein